VSVPYQLLLPASADRGPWLAARRGGIGSSDVADILGVGFGPAQRVYYDKTGQLPLEDRDIGEAALWGTLDEETTAREWARRNRAVVRRVGLIARKDQPWQMCTLDRQVKDCPENQRRRPRVPMVDRPACALEVKHTGAFMAGKWKRSIPDHVLAQVLWQIHITGYDHMHVACRIGGNDYRQFTIRRKDHAALIRDIVAAVTVFWERHILARRVPALTGEENVDKVLDLLTQLYPNRSGIASLNGDTAVEANLELLAYEENRLRATAYKKAQDAAKARLVELLGDNEAAVLFEQDEPAYGWDSTGVDGEPYIHTSVDMARLAERWPEAYDDCVRTKKIRRFSIARSRRLKKEDIDVQQAA
jgi:putative phage-type endonuclease